MADIWWVNHYAKTPDMPGGSRHYDMGTELAQRGHRVTVFAANVALLQGKRTRLAPGHLYSVEQRDGIEFVWVRSTAYASNNWRRVVNMLSFARNLRRVARIHGAGRRPALVIGSSPDLFAAASAERVARDTGARFILELRDLLPQAMVDTGMVSEGHPLVRVMRHLERRLYRAARHTIILASGSRRYLEGRGLAPSSISLIPNGVHLGSFKASLRRDAAREHYGFRRFALIYAGAHGPNNSLDTIVRAAVLPACEHVDFVLVGDGPAKKGLVGLAETLGAANVRFLPPVAKTEIPDLLCASDGGVITLLNTEAFSYGVSPNKLFDYMGARLPVVCAVPGDMARMVEEAGAGVTCTAQDPEALADAVGRMVALSGDERAAMAARGHAYLAANYRRETLADRLDEVIRRTLEEQT